LRRRSKGGVSLERSLRRESFPCVARVLGSGLGIDEGEAMRVCGGGQGGEAKNAGSVQFAGEGRGWRGVGCAGGPGIKVERGQRRSRRLSKALRGN